MALSWNCTLLRHRLHSHHPCAHRHQPRHQVSARTFTFTRCRTHSKGTLSTSSPRITALRSSRTRRRLSSSISSISNISPSITHPATLRLHATAVAAVAEVITRRISSRTADETAAAAAAAAARVAAEEEVGSTAAAARGDKFVCWAAASHPHPTPPAPPARIDS